MPTRSGSCGGALIKDECLVDWFLIGKCQLRRAINEFVAHYHGERNHQGLGNELIAVLQEPARAAAFVGIRASAGCSTITIAQPDVPRQRASCLG